MSNFSPDRNLRDEPLELSDLLDRLLDTGVVLRGKVLIRVAEIDLIYLDLSLVLCSIDRALQLDSAPADRQSSSAGFAHPAGGAVVAGLR